MDVCNLIQMVHLKYIRIMATPAPSFVNDRGNLPRKQKFLSCVEIHGSIVSQIHPVVNLILWVCVRM